MGQQRDLGNKITVPTTGGQRKVVGERADKLPDLSGQPSLGSLVANRPLKARDTSSNTRGGRQMTLARGRKLSR